MKSFCTAGGFDEEISKRMKVDEIVDMVVENSVLISERARRKERAMTKSKNFVGNQPMDTGEIPKLGGKTSIKPREDNWWWRQTREETQNIKKKVEEKKTEEKEN